MLLVVALALIDVGRLSNTARLCLSLVALPPIVLLRLGPRLGRWRHAVWGVLIVIFGIFCWSQHVQPLGRLLSGKRIQYWNTYHYYLGSKFFNELGYYNLYGCTLLADREDRQVLKTVHRAMDLHTYQRERVNRVINDVDCSAFTAARWAEFQADFRWIYEHSSKRRWRYVLVDHGYNATPFNNTVFGAIANLTDLRSPWQRTIAFSLDTLFFIGCVLLVGWAFGRERALAFGVFIAAFFGTENLQATAWMRYDWFFALTLALCLYRRRRGVGAGAAWGYAAMARIFPAMLLLGPALSALGQLVQTRRIEPLLLRTGMTSVVFVALAFPMGALNTHGFQAWDEFFGNIRQHTAKHYLGPKRMGLKKLMTIDYTEGEHPDSQRERVAAYGKNRVLHYALMLALLALTVLAVRGRSPSDAAILGLGVVFALVVLSRYYWLIWGYLLLLDHRPAAPARRWIAPLADGLALGIIPAFYIFRAMWENDYEHYSAINGYMFVALTAILVAGIMLVRRRPPAATVPELSSP